VAELFLTDLCFEDTAEAECDSYVSLALKIKDLDGEPVIDALQTAASLRLSQSRKEEARKFILRAYNKMRTGCEALANLVGLEEKAKRAVELVEVDAANSLPSFEFRCQTAKLLLECAATEGGSAGDNGNNQKPPASELEQEQQQCNRAAIRVLGSLLAENDEIPEVYYLLGCAYMASETVEVARHYWTQALELLVKMQKDLEEDAEGIDMKDDDDEDEEELNIQLQSINCQMEEVRSKLEEIDEEKEAMEE
jgi:hypothetical protein